MKIFAIGDLHLQKGLGKPMNVFGDLWDNHEEKLQTIWDKEVRKEDLILITGDISWAMKQEEALPHLEWLHNRPGKKILVKGNHDYWWQKIGKLNQLYEDLFFLQNIAYVQGDIGLCGTRGWQIPPSDAFIKEGGTWSEKDVKIYEREVIRLELSMKDALAKGARRLIVMLHYPPTNEHLQPSHFTKLIHQYPVCSVVYGHLHDRASWENSLQGEYKECIYHLVSSDYLEFKPKRIM
jgi:hypothetical protein